MEAIPYSFEFYGDLERYLIDRNMTSTENLFFGFSDFFEIKKRGFLIPNITLIRVNDSPIPDKTYFVNKHFLLESKSEGEYNMSSVGAAKGVYAPKKILHKKAWSIYGLNLNRD